MAGVVGAGATGAGAIGAAGAGIGRGGRGRGNRGWCRRWNRGRSGRGRFARGRRGRGGGRTATGFKHRDRPADRQRIARFHEQFDNPAGMAAGDGQRGLVGFQLQDILPLFHLVADVHQHFEDVARLDAVTQFRQFDFNFHDAMWRRYSR